MTPWAHQPSTPCSWLTHRAISVCGRSTAPHRSSTANHSSQVLPVFAKITASEYGRFTPGTSTTPVAADSGGSAAASASVADLARSWRRAVV